MSWLPWVWYRLGGDNNVNRRHSQIILKHFRIAFKVLRNKMIKKIQQEKEIEKKNTTKWIKVENLLIFNRLSAMSDHANTSMLGDIKQLKVYKTMYQYWYNTSKSRSITRRLWSKPNGSERERKKKDLCVYEYNEMLVIINLVRFALWIKSMNYVYDNRCICSEIRMSYPDANIKKKGI